MSFLKNQKIALLSIFLMAIVVFISACSSKTKTGSSETIKRPDNLQSEFLDEYLEAKWLNKIDDVAWNDIKETGNKISYQYILEKTDQQEVEKVVSYEQNPNGLYNGVMTISFSKSASAYIANIPKSFASHIDQLDFSVEPSKIINPDPIVEFKNIQGDISIESKETKTQEEIHTEIEKQIIDTETKRCEELSDKESLGCILSLISKYRDSKYIEEELKRMDMAELLGASAQAVLQSDIKLCRHINDTSAKDLCYEYAYQILVKDCNQLAGAEYRECVRTHSNNFPSLKEQRLFCAYIDDEDMRKECQGLAPLETCNEIQNEDERFKCKLNILRTGNDLSQCAEIEDKELGEACLAVIGSDREDASVCKQIKDEYLKGQCLTKVAMVTKNKDLCSIINDDASQNLCNGFFIMKADATKEMCESSNELFLKELCEMTLAIQEKDFEKCQKPEIIGYDNISTCLAGIGMKHDDIDACDMIDAELGDFEEERKLKEMTRDLCYLKIATSKKDSSICEKITNPEQKKICEDQLKKEESESDETSSKQEDVPRMSCADVTPPICPLENAANNGATIHLEDNGHDVQCTYYKNREAGYPLYTEMYKLGKTRDGSYKKYYKSGKIEIFSEHKDGKADGFRIECNEAGDLTLCHFYNPGEQTQLCMP